MPSDDRLATVLRAKVSGAGPARIQYRQLLDLLTTSPVETRGDLLEAAYARLAELALMLPVADRAALLAEPALPPAAHAAICARLWAAAPLAPRIAAADDIAALLARIEDFRRAREAADPPRPRGASPPLPTDKDEASRAGPLRSFDFTSNPAGRITWAEPPVARMVVGIDLGQFRHLLGALRHHQPIRAAGVTLAGASAIAGDWQIDASPRFSVEGGRFLGHFGRFRRHAAAAAPPSPRADAARAETDRLRQVLHELRNPVNAIQGFAEIIQQQLFGPTPHEYRALAAVIAADSARILAGLEELERLAGLASHTIKLIAGESDLAACVAATVDRLKAHTEPRANNFLVQAQGGALRLPLAPIETERLCWRLLATLAGCATPGETLRLNLRRIGPRAELAMQLPAVLAVLDDDALLHAASERPAPTLAVGMFGTGFALRLAASEASAAGGRLERAGEYFVLVLPTLAEAAPIAAADAPAQAAAHPAGAPIGDECNR